jgi:SAM-dependent methyltransferase
MDKQVFDIYSRYYDLLYKDKDYEAETAYVDQLIRTFHPDTLQILELGCGTGIHASQLAARGYHVHGIDRSDTMLRMALDRQSRLDPAIGARLSFMEGDIRNYREARQFDTVISLFHVMSYMTAAADLEQAIRTARTMLKQNGLFIFDCWHGPAVLHDKPVSRTKTFEDDTMLVTRTSVPDLYFDRHVVDVNFTIRIHDKKTQQDKHLQEIHSMRYLFTEELKSLLDENGLEMIHAEAWMSRKPLSEQTWNACYICRNKP